MLRAWFFLTLSCLGCLPATLTQVKVDRSMMAPLHDPPAAALLPSQYGSVFASVSTLPGSFGGGTLGGEPNTGIQLPLVQANVGALLRFDSGVFFGADLRAADASTAVKATSSQVSMNGGFLGGFHSRVGYAFESEAGWGVIASLEPGFDLLPQNDTLAGSQSNLGFALAASLTPTLRVGRARFYAGAIAANVPVMSRTLAVICNSDSGCGDTAWDGSSEWVAGAVAGVRYQLQPETAAALSFTLSKESTGWVPVLALSFMFDVARRREPPAEDPPLPAGPPPRPPEYRLEPEPLPYSPVPL